MNHQEVARLYAAGKLAGTIPDPPSEIAAGIAARIKEARLRAGLKPEYLLGAVRGPLVLSRVVHKWESGHSLPRIWELPRLADALGVTIDWLIRGDPKR